jgi:hypothetical protein
MNRKDFRPNNNSSQSISEKDRETIRRNKYIKKHSISKKNPIEKEFSKEIEERKNRKKIKNGDKKPLHIDTRLDKSPTGVYDVTREDSEYLEAKRFIQADSKPLFMSDENYKKKVMSAKNVVNKYNKTHRR